MFVPLLLDIPTASQHSMDKLSGTVPLQDTLAPMEISETSPVLVIPPVADPTPTPMSTSTPNITPSLSSFLDLDLDYLIKRILFSLKTKWNAIESLFIG